MNIGTNTKNHSFFKSQGELPIIKQVNNFQNVDAFIKTVKDNNEKRKNIKFLIRNCSALKIDVF